jgi:hypothetical protein
MGEIRLLKKQKTQRKGKGVDPVIKFAELDFAQLPTHLIILLK